MAPLDYPETNLFREINGYSIEAIRISKRKRIVHSINITIPPLRVDDVKRRSYNPVRARKPPLRPRHIPGPKPIHPRLRIALLPRKLQCCRRLTRRRIRQRLIATASRPNRGPQLVPERSKIVAPGHLAGAAHHQ